MDKLIKDLCVEDRFVHFSNLNIRVLKKTPISEFHSTKNTRNQDGKYFRCLLIDKEGDAIEAISFDIQKYDLLVEGKCYKIQAFEVKKPNIAHKYASFYSLEITITKDTNIIPIVNAGAQITINHTIIKPISEVKNNTQLSIAGNIMKITTIGADLGLRCTIADETGSIDVKFWDSYKKLDFLKIGTHITAENIKFTLYKEQWIEGNTHALAVIYATVGQQVPDITQLLASYSDIPDMSAPSTSHNTINSALSELDRQDLELEIAEVEESINSINDQKRQS